MAKLYEHQAKALLQRSGVNVPRGTTSDNPADAILAAEEIGFPVAVKAQVLTGVRVIEHLSDMGEVMADVLAG